MKPKTVKAWMTKTLDNFMGYLWAGTAFVASVGGLAAMFFGIWADWRWLATGLLMLVIGLVLGGSYLA